MTLAEIILVIAAILDIVSCQDLPVDPALGKNLMLLIDAMTHLNEYGYIHLDPSKVGGEPDMEETRQGITNYQTFFGLPVTNVVDRLTLDHMKMPRCGCLDPVELMVDQWNPEDLKYVTSGGKWNKTVLSYRVTRIPSNLHIVKSSVRRLTRKAFKLWSETTSLEFIEARKSVKADIMIKFAQGFHNGPHNFFGPFDEIAHAFTPVPREAGYSHLAGHVHIDASENWATDDEGQGNSSFALFPTLLHEIGHTLGLAHSSDPTSVMTPLTTNLEAGNNVQLSQDDVDGIRSLYGPKLPGSVVERLCLDISPPYDAITVLFGEIYLFKGARFWRLQSPGVISPTSGIDGELMTTKWTDVPSNIDAVYQSTKTWDVFFFKGERFWVYAGVENHPLIPGYPKPIRLLTLPNGLDAAVHTGDTTYFIKGRSVWQINEDQAVDLGTETPQIVEYHHWRNLPNRVDTAFFQNEKIFSVKGDSYYYIEPGKSKLHQGKSFRQDFLGCNTP